MCHLSMTIIDVFSFSSSEYYFSDVNLAKDVFIRQEMDSEGFVPVAVIAAFPRIEKTTKDVDLIVAAVKDSTVVETKDGKVNKQKTATNM